MSTALAGRAARTAVWGSLVLMLGALGCATTAGTSPRADLSPPPEGAPQVQAPEPPAPPSAGLAVGEPGEWAPPQVVGGDLEALRRTLEEAHTVEVRVGASLYAQGWAGAVQQWLTSLVPSLQVAVRDRALLEDMLVERGELPFGQRIVPEGTHDVLGRPNYTVRDVFLRTDWLNTAPPLAGVHAIVIVHRPRVPADFWERHGWRVAGGCEGIVRPLEEAANHAEALMAPLRTWADEILEATWGALAGPYLDELASQLAAWQRPRRRAEFESRAEWERYRCGHQAWAYVDAVRRCLGRGAQCELAPRLRVANGRLAVVAGEPSEDLPDGCRRVLGADVRGWVRQLAERTAQAVVPLVPAGWADLLARIGAMHAFLDKLGGLCSPRRVRYAPGAVQRARAAVRRAFAALSAPPAKEAAARWQFGAGVAHVAGVGPAWVAAALDANASRAARTVREAAHELDEALSEPPLCERGGTDAPVQVTAIDVGSGVVRFLDYFFEEEVLCPAGGPHAPPPGH